jgi:hypothetical protein
MDAAAEGELGGSLQADVEPAGAEHPRIGLRTGDESREVQALADLFIPCERNARGSGIARRSVIHRSIVTNLAFDRCSGSLMLGGQLTCQSQVLLQGGQLLGRIGL